MGGYFYIAEAECGIEEQIAVITFPWRLYYKYLLLCKIRNVIL
jgi:hypothetical protein